MKFMMLVKAAEGMPAVPELYDAIGRLAGRMMEAGVLLDMGGLAPTVQGTRIRLAMARLTNIDGPFAETKEVIGGYAVLKAASKAEAIELGRQFMQVHADLLGPEHVVELEIREILGQPTEHP